MHSRISRFVPASLLVVLLVAGCAHVISPQMRQKAEGGPEFSMVLANPDIYTGKTVIWGGIILNTVNREDSTMISVLQTPLDYEGMPTDRRDSQGRFLVKIVGYADSEVYRPDSLMTVAGEIVGKEALPVGDTQYTYPVVLMKENHLWGQYSQTGYYGPPAHPFWYWYGYPPGYWYGYPTGYGWYGWYPYPYW